MNQRHKSSAIEEAMSATTIALEYSRRWSTLSGFLSYNPDEAIRLGQIAVRLSEVAPDDYSHSVWSVDREGEPSSTYQIKEHVSDRASKESIFKASPLEFWADHIEWCT